MTSLREQTVSALEMMPLLADRLAAGQPVRGLRFTGVSMRPMLREGKDTVELTAAPETLRKYDLPVYRVSGGKYVMHRVVRVEADHYVCLGDNTYNFERVEHKQVAALVSAFTRGGRRISVDNRWYLLYCRVWCALIPLRRFSKRAGYILRRLLK